MKKLLLQVENLSLTRSGRTLLNGVSFQLHTLETMAVIGAKDAGQGQLLKCLMGIQHGTLEGRVELFSDNKIGFVSGAYPCSEELTVFENLSLALKLMGVNSRSFLGEEVEEVLKEMELWTELKLYLHEKMHKLNDYQKVRLNLARTLLLKPSVLLLEHPCEGLDPLQKAHYESLIEKIIPRTSVIWVTHDLEQAARVSESILFLKDGQMVEFGRSDMVFTMPISEDTESFITRRAYV